MRGSVFDDPGDEKSWHVSQRSEDLRRYYEGREPSWYASAVAPFAGADRVLDLGCGPGLALHALRELGCSTVLGVDRWPAFVAEAPPGTPIITHDLSLPMPFLDSASFDGILSHYALDYVSPVCVRQVLREAHRLLAPGGTLIVYLAAIGLGGGDESRTIAYSPGAMRTLLGEAGFEDLDVEFSPNGRNTVARARRSAGCDSIVGEAARPVAAVDGDTQLSVAFPPGEERIVIELRGDRRQLLVAVEMPDSSAGTGLQISLCARVLRPRASGADLQLCAWRGRSPLVAERVRVEFPVTEMRVVEPGAEASHVSVWRPGELALEPPGDGYVDSSRIRPGAELSEAERGAEGRRVIVDGPLASPHGSKDRLGPGRNRFLVRRSTWLDVETADREWLARDLHGVVVMTAELSGEELRDLLLWCGWRQCPLYLTATNWAAILGAARQRRDEMRGPVVLVDPTVSGAWSPQPLPADVVDFVLEDDRSLVLLGTAVLERSPAAQVARLSSRLLLSGPPTGDAAVRCDAEETLRHLTERTLLMRLRQVRRHMWTDIGRRWV